MSIFGQLRKAGIESTGKDINIFDGNLIARNVYNPLGGVWYVNGDVTTSKSGKSWAKAFKTVTEAIAAASDDDTIVIAPGVYSEAATLNITQENLKIFGSGTSGYIWGPTSLKSNTCADHLITINANGVEIAGLDFICNTNNKDAIRVATTVSIYKTHIHDCHFGGGTGEYGVYTGDTYDSVDMHIDKCEFYNYATCGVRLNGTRDKVTNCFFIIPAAGIGIEYVPNTADRPDTLIADNKFLGSNSTDVGIKITNSPNEDTLIIMGNKVENCATPITVSKYTSWYDGNYWGINDAKYHREARTWYVDAAIATAGDGKCWMSAFDTVTAAVAVASARDTILVMPGDYDEGATIAITTNGLTIKGYQSEFNQNRAMVYDGAGAGYDLMTIDAHEVTIDGLAFSAAVDTYDGIVVGGTSASFKVCIKNCRLDGWDGEYGIQAGSGDDCPDILIEGNLIRSWNTAGIQVNCTRSVVRNNVFHVVTDKFGLEHVPAAGDRPDNVYVDNLFSGVANASTTGIKFTGAPSNGTILVARNMFTGTFDTVITKIAAYGGVWNYVSDNGGGNTLVDMVT